MSIELAQSMALDAIAVFDMIRYSSGSDVLPKSVWERLQAARSAAEALPADSTDAATLAALAARLVGPHRLATLPAADLGEVFGRARPIARLAPRYAGQRFAEAALAVAENEDSVVALASAVVSSGFTDWWTSEARSQLSADASTLRRDLAGLDVDHVLFLVGKLRQGDVPQHIKVYLSACYSGVGSRLSEVELWHRRTDEARSVLRFAVHELLRGFARSPLLSAYAAAMRTDPYLRTLLSDSEWSSVVDSEEMFIVAAELYIAYKAGLYTLEEAFAVLDGLHGNSLPLSVIALDLLLRSDGLPGLYDAWLLDRFRNGTFRVGRIAEQVDEILPGYSESVQKSRVVGAGYRQRLRDLGLA